MNEEARQALLKKVREKMQTKKGGRARDPFEYRPPVLQRGAKEEPKFRFAILPGLRTGEQCVTGTAEGDMGDLWFYTAGTHWINNRPHECPRIHDQDQCPFCDTGFDLMNQTDDKEQRSKIARAYLPRSFYAVNIYFPPFASTPEEFRDKVFWYQAPKTVYDKLDACIMRDPPRPEEERFQKQAFGLFYLPEDCYIFQLEVKEKGGFNNYETSMFLPDTKGCLASLEGGGPDKQKIEQILAMRHDIPKKFAHRDIEGLQKEVDKLLNKASGFDQDETSPTPESTPEPAPQQQQPGVLPDPADPSTSAQQPQPVTVGSESKLPPSKADAQLQQLLNKIKKRDVK